MKFYLSHLQNEFDDRCTRNPHYSVRSFAKFLDMESSTLSRILNQKTIPTRKTALKICAKLNLNPGLSHQFVVSVDQCTQNRKIEPVPDSMQFHTIDPTIIKELTLESALVSELIKCDDCTGTFEDIMSRTGFTLDRVKKITGELQSLGMAIVEQDRLLPTYENYLNRDRDVPSLDVAA